MRLILDVKTISGVGFDTDHRLIRVRFRVPPRSWNGCGHSPNRRTHHGRIPKLQISKLGGTELAAFNNKMQSAAADGLLDDYELWFHGVRIFAEEQVGVLPRSGKLITLAAWKN